MPILLVALVALVMAVVPGSASAHSDLQQAEPAAGAAVPSPPAALRLRFGEPLDLSATRVVVTDARGERVDLGQIALGPPNDRGAIVALADGLGEGVYTVRWWTLSQVDGHRWQGVYRFGVGRVPPGLGETAAPLPSPAELLVRWLALLATALVIGGLAFRAWVLDPVVGAEADQRCPAALARVSSALRAALWLLAAASLGEFVVTLGLLQSSAQAPDTGLGVGKAGALALLRLALAPMIGTLAGPAGSNVMALAFAGMLVLTRGQASHAAQFGLWPILVDASHQLIVAVWVGGVAQVALVLPLLATTGLARGVLARFALVAVGAAGLAVVTGLLNALALGLEPVRLLESRYGQTLALKLALVLALFAAGALAWHRQRNSLPTMDRGAVGRAARDRNLNGGAAVPGRFPSSAVRRPSTPVGVLLLPAELAVGAAVLLAAGALALLPSPGEAATTALELVRPVGMARVHLRLDPLRVGDARAVVGVAERDGIPLPASDLRVTLTPLDVEGREATFPVTSDGRIAARLPIDRPGWWRLGVAGALDGRAFDVPFELLVPDPNRAGVDPPAADPAAARLFAATVDRMQTLPAVLQRDALADGSGGLIVSTVEYAAPNRSRLTTEDGDRSVTVGLTQQLRRAGESAWQPVRRTTPFRFPIYRATYEGAIAQRLGVVEDLAGVPVRVLSFYVPRDRSWYCWWVGRDDGLVHREAMIAPSHYMTSEISFDTPPEIEIES